MDIVSLKMNGIQDGIQNRSSLLSNGPKRFLAVGKAGSGKTAFVFHTLSQMVHKPLGGVFVVSQTPEQNHYQDLRRWCAKEDIMFIIDTKIEPEYFEMIFSNDLPKLVLFDDFNYRISETKYLSIFFRNGRQRNIYVVVISQDLTSVDKDMRINCSGAILFPMSSGTLAQSMLRQMATFISPEVLAEAYKYICRKENKHSCIFLSNDGGRNCIIHADKSMIDLENGEQLVLAPEKKGKKKKDEEEEEEEEEREEEEVEEVKEIKTRGRKKK